MESRKSGNSRIKGESGKIIIATPEDFPQNIPTCPECGGKMGSAGSEWRCPYCCRRTKKVKRGKERDRSAYPLHCGERTLSMGINFVCRVCGRTKRKYLVKNTSY